MKTLNLAIACTFVLVASSSPLIKAQTAESRTAAGATQKTATTQRRVVRLPGAPPSSVPLSPAIVAGEFIFTSGQIAFDPKTGQMVAGGTAEQAEQVLLNLKAVLEAGGSSLAHVLKTTVFLADMNDFNAMNEVYRRHFKEDPPARTTVQVARLPANAKIEIEAVALVSHR
jgi:2-iminobutanoate/2-iminopropanoate deaminase